MLRCLMLIRLFDATLPYASAAIRHTLRHVYATPMPLTPTLRRLMRAMLFRHTIAHYCRGAARHYVIILPRDAPCRYAP